MGYKVINGGGNGKDRLKEKGERRKDNTIQLSPSEIEYSGSKIQSV